MSRQNLLLALFGVMLGLSAIGAAYPFLHSYLERTPEGSQFESIEDFQRAMLRRDERDVRSDNSVSLRSIITPHPSDRIMYDLLPGLDVTFQGMPLRTNSCGMRSPERPIAKAPDVYRIALLGDSFAFGWGVKIEESFGQILENELNEIFQGKPRVEVLNFGIPGYSTFQEVALLEEKGLDFEPDAVLVYFIENDFGLPFFIKSIHQTGEVVASTNFARQVWAGEDPLVSQQNQELSNMLDPNRALRKLVKLTKDNPIPIMVAINPREDWKRDKSRLWILKKNPRVSLLALRDDFMKIVEAHQINPRDLSLPTDPHPSALKHRILGKLLAMRMAPAVEHGAIL